MLQHYVVLKYREGTSAAHVDTFCERMLALRATIPEIRHIEIGRDDCDGFPQQFGDFQRLQIQLELTALKLCQIQEIIDEPALDGDVTPNHPEIFAGIGRNTLVVLENSRRGQDRCERSTKLVRQHGEELILRAICCLDVSSAFRQFVLPPQSFRDESALRCDPFQHVELLL